LTEGTKTDEEKFEIIYNFIIGYISYDYDKIDNMSKGYIPDPQTTLIERKGICYDYSSLLASMLRAVGIPTKIVKGYSTYSPIYHSWNEVLINGK